MASLAPKVDYDLAGVVVDGTLEGTTLDRVLGDAGADAHYSARSPLRLPDLLRSVLGAENVAADPLYRAPCGCGVGVVVVCRRGDGETVGIAPFGTLVAIAHWELG